MATDQAAGLEHYQQVKLMDGTAASTTEIQAGAGTAANALRVTLASDTPFALKAGTASVGTVGINTGTNSIGTVGINAGTAAIGSVKAAGAVAHDAAGTSILPLLTGAIAYATDGTAPGTAVAEADISRLKSDLDGRLLVNRSHPASGSYNLNSSSAQTATTAVAAPAAGFCVYIAGLHCSAITAQTLKVHDEDDNVLIPIQYYGANTGIVSMDLSSCPIRVTAAKAVEFTSTAAVAHSTLIQYYVAP